MLKQPYNELQFAITITSTSPLLIRESRFDQEQRDKLAGTDREAKKRMPNVIPISRASQQEIDQAVSHPSDPLGAVGRLPFFLPAASLRGSFRSHLERTLRSLDSPDTPRVCDPLEEDVTLRDSSCSQTLSERRDLLEAREKDLQTHIHDSPPYTLSCPVCRLFGSTLQASRVSFTEGERLQGAGELVQRDHVRIDRRRGSVVTPPGPLRFYGLLNADFAFTISLRNFELAHALLMGVLLSDLSAGNIILGSGKSKGYGRVRLKRCDITLSYFGSTEPDDLLRGVTEHRDQDVARWFIGKYNLKVSQIIPKLPAANWSKPTPWRHQRMLTLQQYDEAWRQLKLDWGFAHLSRRLELPQ